MTLLVNSKMHPALAARVSKSVKGKTRAGYSFARFAIIGVMLYAVITFVTARSKDRADTATLRATLLATARAKQATPYEQKILDRVDAAITGFSRIDDDVLPTRTTFETIVKRPSIWFRGPIAQMNNARRFSESSPKDALLLCLIDPPKARTEKDLYERARDSDLEAKTSHVRRLHEAVIGLPYLSQEFGKRVVAADDSELPALKREIDKAPIDRASQAADAEMLIVAADEPGDGIVELDGERPHFVRVGIVDLASGQIVVKLRRKVDPSWISNSKRATTASGIDSCALAWDLRSALK